MKVKVEFYFDENIEKQIKDFDISDEKVKDYENNKDKWHKKLIKEIERSIRIVLEWNGYATIEDFKVREIKDEN
ncbi:hypothetical protein [Anaerococcus lactolyticus]|uniref:hypothetical protein n=1 Tax=Anaerococcus lactolyticus TaxID=33032 RepID=UPI00288AF7A5|nr:hypothetical protein [Anaerococcus lactolyticus]